MTVMVVDDHPTVLQGLRSILESDPTLRVVAEAGGVRDAIPLVREKQPAILLIDMDLFDGTGFQLMETVQKESPQTRCAIITFLEDKDLAEAAMRKGAWGYIGKSAPPEELLAAIHAIGTGRKVLDPGVQSGERSVTRRIRPPEEEAENPCNGLTPRETEVLLLICGGYRSKEIGFDLDISSRTVDNHRANIYRKLGVQSEAELVRLAMRWNVIQT